MAVLAATFQSILKIGNKGKPGRTVITALRVLEMHSFFVAASSINDQVIQHYVIDQPFIFFLLH